MTDPDASSDNTWRRFVWDRSTTVFRNPFGVRFMGAIGLMFDMVTQGVNDALYSPYIESTLYSRDALEELAEETNIPLTPVDTHVTLRSRLRDVWDTQGHGGTEFVMAKQLLLAGYPGATFELDLDSGSPFDFFVRFPPETFNITSQGGALGSWALGAYNAVLGPAELSWDSIYSAQRIILHFKPSRYRCSALIIEYGAGLQHYVPVQRTGIQDLVNAIQTESSDNLSTENGLNFITEASVSPVLGNLYVDSDLWDDAQIWDSNDFWAP